jgi:ABC-type sugar transport system ATPase subunit
VSPPIGAELLRAEGIVKAFGHIRAVQDVTVIARAGEVVAIVGDNGAGKSTLLKAISGVIQPDAGVISVRGKRVRFRSPADARREGISAVFQDLALVECLDIATNMFLGEIPRGRLFVDRKQMDEEASRLLTRVGITGHSPRTAVGMLPAGHRQAIAIARAIRADASVVVLDEPTASLGVLEKTKVIDLIARLKAERKAVLLVSHDLELVFRATDRIQVLRLGMTSAVRATQESDRDEIVGLITGTRT